MLLPPRSDDIEGSTAILRYVARASARAGLYGTDALSACQVRPAPP